MTTLPGTKIAVGVGVGELVGVIVAVGVSVGVDVISGVGVSVAVGVGVSVIVGVGVLVGVGVAPPVSGAKATPRKALFVPAVVIIENASLGEFVSVTLTSLLAVSGVVAQRTACPDPLMESVRPRKPVVSPLVKVFARLHVPALSVHFCNPPPEAIALSSAT
jgi:hypothetical protein